MANYGRKRSKNGLKIPIDDIVKSVKYSDWSNPQTMKAFKVVREMQEFFDKQCMPEHTPKAWLSVADFALVVMVNDICVFDSVSYEHDELTKEKCLDRYKQEVIYLLAPFDL